APPSKPKRLLRLWGVADAEDAAARAKAKRYLEECFRRAGRGREETMWGRAHVRAELRRGGQTFVWLMVRFDGHDSCPNEDLVCAGLARIDFADYEDVTFTDDTKAGRFVHDWKGSLQFQAAKYAKSDKPQLLYDWPEFERQ